MWSCHMSQREGAILHYSFFVPLSPRALTVFWTHQSLGSEFAFFSLSCIFALFFTHFIIYIDCNLLVHIHFSGFATASASSSHSGLLDSYHWARNSLNFRCRVSFYCFIHITILSWSASTYITLIFDVSQQRFPPIACMVILPSNDGRYIISVVW